MSANRPIWPHLVVAAGVLLGGVAVGSQIPGGTDDPERCISSTAGAEELRAELDRRQRALELREQTLDAERAELETTKESFGEMIAELEQVRTEAEAALDALDADDEARLLEAAKRLDAMKSGAAAEAMTELLGDEPERAVLVFDRMNRSKAGKMLSAIAPSKAAELLERSSRPLSLAEAG